MQLRLLSYSYFRCYGVGDENERPQKAASKVVTRKFSLRLLTDGGFFVPRNKKAILFANF